MSMAEIEVTETAGGFSVTVTDGSGRTTHDVTGPAGYATELGLADVDRKQLVERSFEFLLEREPKESIMRRFDLQVIGRYFPEYSEEIRRRLGSA